MDWAFDISIKNRKLLESFLENYSLEQLNKIPKGFSNNIIWNIAHTIVTQQLLVYRLSGLPCMISDDLIERFKKGTKPESDLSQAEVDAIHNLLFSTIEKTKEDYKNKSFQQFNEYTVTTKSRLTNVEEAIDFNCYHEGIHLGVILAIRKFI
ncbi:DinB family protein [Hanstruepera ponticola]|uniref:DinB family protein n=1 Tax=Hanstruepera ponticola TaxID=2042995 RepID=UPI000CF0A7F6|nr:DinB family protein [Hanstruepera ponticola]